MGNATQDSREFSRRGELDLLQGILLLSVTIMPALFSALAVRCFQRSRRAYVSLICHALRRLSSRPLEANTRTALIVSPHPDDETLGCGGLIALKRQAGAAVWVVFLTDGSAAPQPDSRVGNKDFVEERRREAIEAARVLSLEESSVIFLDTPDSTLRNPTVGELVTGQLSLLLTKYRPDEVYTPHRADQHPDHEAAWTITNAAIRQAGLQVDLFQYSIWMLWSAPLFIRLFPRHLKGARILSIRSVQEQKARAIAAYVSQCATLPRGFLARFREPFEIFFDSPQP